MFSEPGSALKQTRNFQVVNAETTQYVSETETVPSPWPEPQGQCLQPETARGRRLRVGLDQLCTPEPRPGTPVPVNKDYELEFKGQNVRNI